MIQHKIIFIKYDTLFIKQVYKDITFAKCRIQESVNIVNL